MLHILFLILKIIGIVIASLLCLLLLLLVLVLFVPVHYQLEAQRTEGEGNPPVEAVAKITWLLHFLNVKLCYPSESYLRVRILFFTIYKLPPKQKKEKADNRKKNRKKNRQKENIASNNALPETNADELIAKDVIADEAVNSETLSIETDTANFEADYAGDSDAKEPKISVIQKVIQKIGQLFQKIKQLFQKIRYTIKGIYDRIKDILDNIEYYLGVLQSETFRQSFLLCKGELFDILNYIKPRKLQAEVYVGMNDPAATGQILSYYGILYPLIGDHITVVGDFEKKRFEGSIFIKGKIQAFKFVKAGIRIFFSKDIRKLLKLLKKEEL